MKRYSLKRKEEPIVIEDEAGKEQTYIIRELTGKQRSTFMNKIAAKTKLDPKTGQPTGLRSTDGLYEELITLSLFDPTGKQITPEILAEWPSSVTTDIFRTAQRLSGLGEEAEEALKKESPASDSPGSGSPES